MNTLYITFLGRCLEATLQTHAQENFHSCKLGAVRRVLRARTRFINSIWLNVIVSQIS